MFNKMLIIGVGLIGGSLARALKELNTFVEIVGAGSSIRSLQAAVDLKVIDRYTNDLSAAVNEADIIIIASPVKVMGALFREIALSLRAATIITDVGSVKADIVNLAREALGDAISQFVPGHPIAGTEKSGVANSFPELYRKRRVILTPIPETNPTALSVVRKMWESVGAKVTEMSIEKHDKVLAAISHLPHILAYSLVDHLNQHEHKNDCIDLVAGGFYDITRIASSDPQMWRDICLANRSSIAFALKNYSAELQKIGEAIENNNGEYLAELFSRAKTTRDSIILERSGEQVDC